MNLSDAKVKAKKIVAQLAPYCDRIEIAGSIRRQKPVVGDIEIVCIPIIEEVPYGLFETQWVRVDGFINTINAWEKVKGDPENGKYTQRIVDGEKVDIFIARPENWGLIFAIRTGSADYSHHVLAAGWKKAGYISHDGMICTFPHRKPIPVREEQDLYDLIKVKWLDPAYRGLTL